MEGKNKLCRALLCSAAGTLLFSMTNVQAAPDQLAEMVAGKYEVWWQPDSSLDYDAIRLQVSTPGGNVVDNSFEAGVSPVYPSGKGDSLEDGSYTYQLTATASAAPLKGNVIAAEGISAGAVEGGLKDENGRPLSSSRAAVSKVAANNDFPAQTGYFSVIDGAVVNPHQEEEK